MSGLIKPKQYDWKDSNLALFGSDTEKQVKNGGPRGGAPGADRFLEDSAAQEPAWRTAGQKPGLQIWRIVNFKVKRWPEADYGKFFDGDSYIILNTYKKEDSDALLYDVHFWIGKYSTQDEYGTAAYKTVELDTYLNDVPIQHREVQEHESALFKSYFPAITYLHGGAESGFHHVKPEKYEPRLLHFHGDQTGVTVTEIQRLVKNIDDDDVYILDLGLTLYQYNGKGSNKDERVKALQYVNDLKTERSGKAVKSYTLDQVAGGTGVFFRYLKLEEDGDDFDSVVNCNVQNKNSASELYRLSDAEGSLKFTLEKSGRIGMKDFDGDDVFIFDTKNELFVWIGNNTTKAEQKNALTYAHNYLKKSDHPLIPVSCLKEGAQHNAFVSALAA